MASSAVSPGQFGGVSDAEYEHAHRVNNIITTYRNADDKTFRSGTEWFDRARRFSKKVGGGDIERGAATISALSPRTRWEANQKQAAELSSGRLSQEHIEALRTARTPEQRRIAREPLKGTSLSAQFGRNIVKAHDIMTGKRKPQEAFQGARDKGAAAGQEVKTGNFRTNIMNPDDPHAVTVDFRAHNVAEGRRLPKEAHGKLSHKEYYDKIGDAYREAGKVLGTPTTHEVQGVTWSQNRAEEKAGKKGKR